MMNVHIENFNEMNVARVRHIGPYDDIPEAYKNLFNVWFPQSGEQMDNRPFMEIYQNSPADTAPEDLLTDLCLPLKSPG